VLPCPGVACAQVVQLQQQLAEVIEAQAMQQEQQLQEGLQLQAVAAEVEGLKVALAKSQAEVAELHALSRRGEVGAVECV